MTLFLQSLVDKVLGLLFPDSCAGCGSAGELLCGACRARLRPYPHDDPTPPLLDGVRVAFIFEEPLQSAIHVLKYDRVRRMAVPLGDMLAEHLRRHPLPADALVAVPLHAHRLQERGFNQSELLAQQVQVRTGLPLLGSELTRCRDTAQQAKLSQAERQENMRDAFVWRGRTPPPPRVLLLDDVLTTGATLGACAEALRAAGTREVRGLALGRSLK
jgi:ComF family protein